MLRMPRVRLAGAAVVLVLLLLTVAGASGQAAPLTGGNTIYVINGEETTFIFDPISRKEGQLIPGEVFQALGLAVAAGGGVVTVSRGARRAVMALGATGAGVGGSILPVAPAPIRLNGRLFLPAALLQELGFEVAADGNYLGIRDLLRGASPPPQMDAATWGNIRRNHTLTGNVRADDNRFYLTAEVTLLTPDLVAAPYFPGTFRQQAEYLDLLRTRTLVMVKLTNHSGQSATLKPESFMLVDPATGVQYDVQQTLSHQGLINTRIASNATKTSVLVYPKLDDKVLSVNVWADSNGSSLGTLPVR